MIKKTKEIWIESQITGASCNGSNISLNAQCCHYTPQEIIHATPGHASKLGTTVCFAKGIINSSGNILVEVSEGGFAPVGKVCNKMRRFHGVQMHGMINDLSRDKTPEYVKSREDAEKICLLLREIGDRAVCDELLNAGADLEKMNSAALKKVSIILESAYLRKIKEPLDLPALNY